MKEKISTRVVNALQPQAKPFEVFDRELKGFLLRVEPSGVMTYYLAYKTPLGKRRRYRIGRHGALTVAQARKLAEINIGLIAKGQDVQQEREDSRSLAEQMKQQSLAGFLEHKYIPWVTQSRKTGDLTIRRLQANFSHLYDLPMAEISPWVIEKWRAEQLRQGKAKNTVNRDISTLRAALSKAVEWGIIACHPFEKIRPLKIDNSTRIRYLTTEEELQLRQALQERELAQRAARESANRWRRERGYKELPSLMGVAYVDYLTPMVLVTLNTGLRRGEIFSLKWADLSFDRKNLTVAGETAKSHTTRHIPLNAEAVNTLSAWKAQSPRDSNYVFPGKDGGRLDNIASSWAALLVRAGVKGFRWHDLRHHFASKLVMYGVPLNTVRELLGHTSIAMTLRYAHLAADHKAEAVAKLDIVG